MLQIVEASRDFENQARFLPEFIGWLVRQSESEAQARRAEMRRAAAVNPERFDRERACQVPYAFQLWFGHLAELDSLAQSVSLRLEDLTPEEARGLAMLRDQRTRFWEQHTRCPKCGAVNPRLSSFCGGCGENSSNVQGPGSKANG